MWPWSLALSGVLAPWCAGSGLAVLSGGPIGTVKALTSGPRVPPSRDVGEG